MNTDELNSNSLLNAAAQEKNFSTTPKLFGKWEYETVNVHDKCLENYMSIFSTKSKVFVPHTAGRYQMKRFRKALCPLIERVIGCLMFKGRNAGKKVQAIKIMKAALEIIHNTTGENPLQVVVNAISNAGPREDSTRIGKGGVAKRQAVDVSSFRRVNFAIFQLCLVARKKAMRTIKTIAECLAEELTLAHKNDRNASGSIKKKEEVEKNAKANR
jgi:small subunit ribosomal protein S5e